MSDFDIKIGALDLLWKIRAQMGEFQNKAPNVLQNAVNNTATFARSQIATAAQKRYTHRDKKTILNKDRLRVGKADKRSKKYVAELHASGMLEKLSYFRVTPNTYGGPVSAQVLAQSAPVLLFGAKPNPFVTRFRSGEGAGHLAVARRMIGQSYSREKQTAKRKSKQMDLTRIEELMGPSVPSMFKMAGEETPGLKGKINERLNEMIAEQMQKMIEKAQKGKK